MLYKHIYSLCVRGYEGEGRTSCGGEGKNARWG